MTKEVCGNCKYNKCERNGVRNSDFYCGNENSYNYAVPTAYDDACDDYEEKGDLA